MSNYDEWLTREPKEIVVRVCDHCRENIYLGYNFYITDQGNVHEDCFEAFAKRMLEAELIDCL